MRQVEVSGSDFTQCCPRNWHKRLSAVCGGGGRSEAGERTCQSMLRTHQLSQAASRTAQAGSRSRAASPYSASQSNGSADSEHDTSASGSAVSQAVLGVQRVLRAQILSSSAKHPCGHGGYGRTASCTRAASAFRLRCTRDHVEQGISIQQLFLKHLLQGTHDTAPTAVRGHTLTHMSASFCASILPACTSQQLAKTCAPSDAASCFAHRACAPLGVPRYMLTSR
jgi:hypothetical protein